MVELRKRKAPEQPPAPPKKTKAPAQKAPPESAADKSKPSKDEDTTTSSKPAPPIVGDTINLDDFGGEIETNDGTKITLKKLVDDSKTGVVLFTYPKASTPGCRLIPFFSLPFDKSTMLPAILL